jgi:hypothetical protein
MRDVRELQGVIHKLHGGKTGEAIGVRWIRSTLNAALEA